MSNTLGASSAAPVHPALALGFRPFYLLAGLYAAVSVAVWALQFAGVLPQVAVHGPWWHAHEMLFGYTLAVVTGFLFTAVRNWTQQATPTGAPLALLAGLWLVGRLLSFTPLRPWSALTDTLFVLGVAWGIARPLFASGNRRNYFFVPLVIGLGAANLGFHAAVNGWVAFSPTYALTLAADVILFVMTVVAGRVVPMFTNNALGGLPARRHALLDRLALGSVLALIVADLLLPALVTAGIAAVAALLHGARLVLWAPWQTRRAPLLWILHLAYGWIVAYLALRAAGFLVAMPGQLALHALTVGAVGGLTLGMMTRSALGHSGRALRAGPAEVASYVLVQLAAIVRVLVPLVAPAWYAPSIAVSAALWSGAFGVFTVAYWPILTRPRVDGKPG